MSAETFDPPRWPGGPVICVKVNLSAFKTRDEAVEFHEKNGPGSRITKLAVCDFCGWWHYRVRCRPPSGDSSGTGRQ